jgi:hypothetical protein
MRQVDTVSTTIARNIADRLAASPNFEGRPDRVEVEAALERIAHRMLCQRAWEPGEVKGPVGVARERTIGP